MKPRLIVYGTLAIAMVAVLLYRVPEEAELLRRRQPDEVLTGVEGTVTDQATGEPLSGVFVLLNDAHMTFTWDSGAYTLDHVPAGSAEVLFRARTYESRRVQVKIKNRHFTQLNVALTPAPGPRFSLSGSWAVRLVLEHQRECDFRPTTDTLLGTMAFSDTLPPIWREQYQVPRMALYEGRHDMDFSKLLGGPLAPTFSSSWAPGQAADVFDQVAGKVFHGDSLTLDFVPRVSHGSVSFEGVIRSDSLLGTWWVRDDSCERGGRLFASRIGQR